MKRSLIVAVVILILVAAVGGGCEYYTHRLVHACQATLTRAAGDVAVGRWQDALEGAEQLSLRWEGACAWIQLWVNHADTDAVSHALRGLLASLNQRDRLSSMLYYGECVENFAHLHHRDAFTLKNIL